MSKVNSLGNRLIALSLSIIMLLGMLPTGAIAVENTSAYGTVESLSDGVSISGEGAEITATFAGPLNWVAADPSIGRNVDGWWVGIKVIAPETMDLENAQFTMSGTAYSFNTYKDSADNAESHYICIWKYIDGDKLRAANLDSGVASYEYTFDWEGDTAFEQKVCINFDADQTILYNSDSTQAYPAATLGYGKVDLLTEGASITSNETSAVSIAYNNAITIDWVAADASIGRYQDGWWAGFRITAPAGMTEDQHKTAQFTMRSGIKSFWDNKDTQEGADVHYVSIWVPLNDLLSGPMDDRTYQFDWNNDGIFEQRIVLSLDSTKITLTKNGAQVYPVLGQVSSYSGGVVTGTGTGVVDVFIEDVTLNWSEADASIGRTQGWWAGIRVEAPVGLDSATLRNAKLQVRRSESDLWENAEALSFWDYKDSADDASVHYVGLWLPVSPSIVAEYAAAGKNITRWYRFDWDNDGTYEQEVTFSIDPTGNIVLNKVDQTGFGFVVETPADIWVGDVNYQNVVTGGQGDGAITYEIVAGDAATVDPATGELTFTKAGTVTVKATKAADSEGYYNETSAQYTITATKEDQYPKFENTNPGVITYAPGLTFENAVEDVLGGTVDYSIVSGDDVATIDPTTGKLTITKAGTVTVKAVIAGDVNYNSAEATYTVVIEKADQTGFAFENAPVELNWQAAKIDALTLLNGKGNGAVTWSITSGTDVASVDQDGKIALLKAGTFTIQAKKAGDECYNDSAAITATILVNPAAQTGFGFGDTDKVTVTYNDNENKYTLAATGGQSSKDILYSVISGDAASVNENTGVVTILKAGTVVVKATKPADDQYSEISDTYELVIEKDEQSFAFNHDKQINDKYGLTSFATQISTSTLNSGVVSYAISANNIGASVDNAGLVSFENSTDKVGTVTVTVTMVEDDCYKAYSDTYTITLGYETTPASSYELHGDKIISDSDWFTSDVKIYAPNNYQISYSNDLTGNEWKNYVDWKVDGEAGTWAVGSEPVVYLKNSTTGAITDAIPVPDLKRDTVKPNGLAISYDVSVWATIGEKLFGFNASTVKVTVTAADSLSGIGKMEYSLDGGNSYTEIAASNGAYEFSVPSQYRGQLWMRATDVAGNFEIYKHLDNDTDKILVVDHTEPGLTVGYTGSMNDADTSGIRYVKSDKVTVVFEITDENFDLRAADPIVTVNGVAETGWIYDATSGTLTFDLTDEGDYVIKAEFTDRLSRKKTYESEVRVDRTKPVIESTIENGKYYTENQVFVLTITEHNFDAAKVNLAVSAVDSKGTAVLNAAEIQAFADLAKNPDNWTSVAGTDEHQLTLEISKDGNYTVEVNCSDNLAWVADTYTATFTVDKVDPNQPTLKYEVGAAKGDLLIETILNKLFGFAKEATVVTVQSGDATSGIDRLEYKLHDSDNFTVAQMDSDGKYSFNLDPQYRGRITVVVYDKAGRSTTTVEEKEIVVDNIAPNVEIEFTGDRQDAVKADNGNIITRETISIPDATTRFIYNGNVTATIKIKEANFFKEIDMPITVTRDGQTVTTGFTDSGWSNEPNADGYYVRTIVLQDDGDYRIKASYKDHSLNDMEWESNEYAQNGVYSYESNIHTIDTKAPVYELTYDNNAVVQTLDGREYYGAAREATIKVTDRNFRPDEVEFAVEYKDIAGNAVTYTYSDLKSWSDWTKSGDTWTATVPFAVDANYTVSFSYDDLANHMMVNTENNEEVYTKQFTVDTTKPVALGVAYNSKDDQVLNKILSAITFGNYHADQEVVLTMKDATAGIDYIKLTVTPEGPASATNLTMPADLVVNADGTVRSGTKGFIGTIKSVSNNGDLTLSFDVPAQFRGKISFVAYDKSGKVSDPHADPGVLVVDTIAPGHTISYNPSNVVNVSDMKDMTGFDAANGIDDITSTDSTYVMYFSSDAVATIKIDEANFDPSVVKIEVLDGNGTTVQGWTQTDWTTVTEAGKADSHTKTVTIPAEGDYQLKVYYQDHSMNTPVDYLSQWIVVDKTAPVIDVKYSNTDVKNTIENRDYFSAAQTATITIKEHNFRADDVVIKVTAKDVLGTDVLTLNADGTVKAYADQGADRKSWTSYEAGTWRVKDDAFIITLNYTTDANYTFDIEYQDLAKNVAADYEQDLFTVDVTAPKNLTVDYSTSVFEQIKESITFGYYNAMMTVTITAEDDTSGIYHFAYSYIKGKDVSGVNAELLDQAIKEAEITYDGKKATATFNIPKMVLGADNQFNGTVEFTAFDRSEVSTELKDSTVIVVDNITPTSKITYNAPVQTANGISYYNGDINATIVITEANFDAKDVVVTVTKDGENFPINVSWKDDSVDTHTGTFTLTKDGDYIVSVQYKDKSGNTMTSYKSNELTLDATKPTIKVSNIKADSANKDEKYGFVITVNDTNLDASSLKPVLKAVVQKEEGVYVTVDIDLGNAKTVVNGQTYTYTVEDLPDDGLYTLTCSVKDMSSNGMSQIVLDDSESYDQVQFSINRNGSAFGYGNKFSEELVGQYYIYSVDEDVVIVEVNVDPIEEYKVTLNGKELVEGTDYTTIQTSKDGEWSKRTYTIKKALFESEGEYSIIVSSTDKADTTAFSDVKNLSLAFVVDQTKPVLTITGLEAGGRYQTDAQTVTLIPTDEGGRLNSLTVLVMDSNGNPLKDDAGADISVRFEMAGEELLKHLEDNDGKVTFTIPEGLNNQVKIICNDCAVNAEDLTNEYNELFERVTVSQNQFVIFYANTPLFVGTIVGVLAVAGLIVFLIKRKGNKKSKAKAKT